MIQALLQKLSYFQIQNQLNPPKNYKLTNSKTKLYNTKSLMMRLNFLKIKEISLLNNKNMEKQQNNIIQHQDFVMVII